MPPGKQGIPDPLHVDLLNASPKPLGFLLPSPDDARFRSRSSRPVGHVGVRTPRRGICVQVMVAGPVPFWGQCPPAVGFSVCE